MLKMTPEEWREHQKRVGRQMAKEAGEEIPVKEKKSSKHRNRPVSVDGITIASKKEARRLLELRAMQEAGEISDLQTQVPFVLAPAVVLNGRKKPPLRYFADFYYCQGGAWIVEDAKSQHLRGHPVYRIKKHLMMSEHGIEIKES